MPFVEKFITIGYEFSVYNATETAGGVELCAIIHEPTTEGSSRIFFVTSTTRDGTASKRTSDDTSFSLGTVCICIIERRKYFILRCLHHNRYNSHIKLFYIILCIHPVGGVDYKSESVLLVFTHGSTRHCHTVRILQNNDCQQPPRSIFAELPYVSGIQPIDINIPTTQIIINDSGEPEC